MMAAWTTAPTVPIPVRRHRSPLPSLPKPASWNSNGAVPWRRPRASPKPDEDEDEEWRHAAIRPGPSRTHPGWASLGGSGVVIGGHRPHPPAPSRTSPAGIAGHRWSSSWIVVISVAGLGRGGGGLLRDWGWMLSVMGFEDDGNTYPGLGHPSCPSQIRHDIGVDVVAAIVIALPSSTSARGIG